MKMLQEDYENRKREDYEKRKTENIRKEYKYPIGFGRSIFFSRVQEHEYVMGRRMKSILRVQKHEYLMGRRRNYFAQENVNHLAKFEHFSLHPGNFAKNLRLLYFFNVLATE